MAFNPKALFQRDPRHNGVPRINVYLMRLVFFLMFFVLGKECWTTILTHKGPWDPFVALAWCVWTGFAMVAGLGIFFPARMVPILLLEIFYKLLWLGIVAYPMWKAGTLTGSPAEAIAGPLLWVPLPIVAVPWGYVVRTYFMPAKKPA
jgi:hypothetical protein